MSSQTSKKQETTAEVTPIKTRGHTGQVGGVVHLPGGQQIITCSRDGSLRLWDLESGTQIGEDWRDDEAKEAGVNSIALSPDGKTVVSGSNDGKMRLWDIETGMVVAKWGHTYRVTSVCWSAGGDRVVSGSSDGTARVWNAKTGEEILEIKTGYVYVWAVKYSPDSTQIATGGYTGYGKIWDAKTGKLTKSLAEFQHDQYRYWHSVSSLAWTSDGKNFITASQQEIKIFDTTPWRLIATLKGHKEYVSDAITLSRNNLLASVSDDQTARIWNLDTNLPVGQLKDWLYSTTFSANGRVLVTGCSEGNMYTWDVHAILEQAGNQNPLTGANIASQDEPGIERTPRSSLSDLSFLEADATRGHDEFGGFDELPPRFFDGMEVNDDSSPTGGAHPRSSASIFLARLASLLHRFRPGNAEANEPSQPPTLLGLHPRVLFARLSLLIHRSPAENDAPNELQQPSTPSRLDLHAILTSLVSSLFPRSQLNIEETESHTVTPWRSRPDAVMNLLSSLFRSQHRTDEDIELSQYTTRLHVVEVAPMRDREVLFVAERAQTDRPHYQSAGTATPGARPVHSRPIRLLGHIGLFLCCVCNHQHTDGNAQPTQQQQGQSQGPVSTQVSSLQTTPAAVSTSTTPTVPTTTPAAATA